MRKLLWIVMVALIAGIAFGNGGSEETPVVEVEDLAGFESVTVSGVTFQWQIDGENLNVQMSAPTTGWVSVGFDPSAQMADANIIIGYVEDGEVFLRDDFGVGRVRHGADVDNGGVSNLSNVEGEEAGDVTTIRFTIPLDSGDALDTPLSAGGTHKMIFAHGPNNADDFGTYHSTRGSADVEL